MKWLVGFMLLSIVGAVLMGFYGAATIQGIILAGGFVIHFLTSRKKTEIR